MGSSSSLAARYPQRDCTYSASDTIRRSKAAVSEAFSGARTRKMSNGDAWRANARKVETVIGVVLFIAAKPDGSPANNNVWKSWMLSWL